MTKEMINTKKAVLVNFTANNPQALASIYIPFPVTEIHVKRVDIDWTGDYCACMFSSSLVNDGPVGGGFLGASFDTTTSTKKI